MAHYRLSHLDLSTRCCLAGRMLNPDRPWGEVTALARSYGVSRKFLYELCATATQAVLNALAPQPPGPKPEADTLVVDNPFLKKTITTLAMIPSSIRGIQLLLELLFRQHRAVGFISQTLQEAGTAAAEYNLRLPLPVSVLGEADEIFQGRQPCLTVVDGRSFLVLSLSPQERRDATTWGVTFLSLQERGVQFYHLACDEAKGLRAGVQEAGLAIPLCPDRFHWLREGYRLTQRLAARAYRAIKTADRARRATQEAQAPRHRRGPRLKVQVEQAQAEKEEAEAIRNHDLWVWLFQEVRQALEPFTPDGQIVSVEAARQTMQTAAELLQELHIPEVTAFAQGLLEDLEALLGPLRWLEQALAPWRENLDPRLEALIVWAWRHRQALGVQIERDFPEPLQATVKAFWEALALWHTSASLAESVHSWLRPFLQIHRGMPKWLLPLLQVFWNHHPFQRGKRKGNSPLSLAGVKNVPSLAQVLDMLLSPLTPALTAVPNY